MDLDHPLIPPFSPLLESVLSTAFTTGLDRLRSDGFKMEDIKTNERARRRFMHACHYGYDKAQKRIANEVLALQDQIGFAKRELKRLRVARDPAAKSVPLLLRVLKNRQLVLRRIVDGILYTIVGRETWVLRQLILDNRIRDLQPDVLRQTMAVASKLNAEDRAKFYLIADLTTVVQIGDLIEENLRSPDARKWRSLN